jgi:hypothetical protein
VLESESEEREGKKHGELHNLLFPLAFKRGNVFDIEVALAHSFIFRETSFPREKRSANETRCSARNLLHPFTTTFLREIVMQNSQFTVKEKKKRIKTKRRRDLFLYVCRQRFDWA